MHTYIYIYMCPADRGRGRPRAPAPRKSTKQRPQSWINHRAPINFPEVGNRNESKLLSTPRLGMLKAHLPEGRTYIYISFHILLLLLLCCVILFSLIFMNVTFSGATFRFTDNVIWRHMSHPICHVS